VFEDRKSRYFNSLVRGGEGGIRTPDTVARMPHFECGAFNRSATSPSRGSISALRPCAKRSMSGRAISWLSEARRPDARAIALFGDRFLARILVGREQRQYRRHERHQDRE
jgi:hypothetical protein